MRITDFSLHRVQIPFKKPFKHARYERTRTDALIVRLRSSDGLSGFGEILPREYVTGETVDKAFNLLAPALCGRKIGTMYSCKEDVIEDLMIELDFAGRNLATFCGFEIALLDLAGQAFGFSLGDVVGREARDELPAGVVIGMEIATVDLPRHCAILRLAGKRHIKVKVGLPDDVERLSIISSILQVPLRLDANGVWASAREAISALLPMKRFSIASIEQPLSPGDLAGARQIREETGLCIMADESVCTIHDADRLVEARAADMLNIRLGKCGGILGSLRLVRRAHAAGIGCNLGTLVGETGILTRAAEVFGRFVPGFACLDGKAQNVHLLQQDIVDAPRDAVVAPLNAPGLGVRVVLERLSPNFENHVPDMEQA